ncbi:MAG TPA: histidine--tRNA ligase [Patescibacteria group bacterium]|jgi:histidyl-tRNA synthetase|nr:histidine--tRNA ligase [Patescibacteria group bacterium]
MINRPRGTQDFLDMSLFDYAVTVIRTFLERSGFKHIQTPVIESVDLFKRSLGLHTDVVGKEMFVLQSHGQEVDHVPLCLRPEMTASVVRAFIEHNVDQLPWRVFSIGPVFRHERPQKGRYRQFHQATIELIGGSSIGYDAQLITILDMLFGREFGLTEYELHLNFLGCLQDRTEYKKLMYTFLQEHEKTLCATCLIRKDSNTLRVFDCKSQQCQALYTQAPFLTEHLCNHCTEEWVLLQAYLKELGIAFIHMPRLVRGLDYYNKTAFEFVSNQLGSQTAFCGGGRYDNLIEQLSPKHAKPAVGAGIGIERLLLLLEQKQLNFKQKDPLIVCIPLEQHYISNILSIAQKLMEYSIRVELLLDGSLKNSMKKASKLMAAYVLLVGQDEVEKDLFTLKDMATGHQEQINIMQLFEKLSL